MRIIQRNTWLRYRFRWKRLIRGGCPKTPKSALEVEDNLQYSTKSKSKVVLDNNFFCLFRHKVENNDQSKMVFGQAEGGLTFTRCEGLH